MLPDDKTNVFFSYSWDNTKHQKWVADLADRINAEGGHSIIDKMQKYGVHLRLFMETRIKAADVVLIILTPKYRDKAQGLKGGVGYEYNIITRELFEIISTNEKYIPVLRNGSHNESVPDFLKDIKYVDLREECPDYDNNLNELIAQILGAPQKHPVENKSNSPVMRKDYKEITQLSLEIKNKAPKYLELIFAGQDDKISKDSIQSKLNEWEVDVMDYHKLLVEKLNPKKILVSAKYLEDFKKNIFAQVLWTVKAALKTRDPDLARYKADFRDADAEEIYETVKDILDATHSYVSETASALDYNQISNQSELGLDFLGNEGMFMNKIIGFGIRSEILHRYYPAYLPIMTQKSLWAMYFICDSAKEFITIEQKNRKGIMRVSHNWQYPYDRFTFVMNEMAKTLENWLSKYQVKLRPEYRFGYVNMFLSSVDELHKPDIKLLHEWVEME